MKFRYLIWLVLLAGVASQIGCGGHEKAAEKESELVAKIDDWTMTKTELEEAIAQLPPSQKKKFDTPEGRVELVDLFIQDNLYFKEAKRLGLENDQKIKAAIDNSTKRILVTEYYNKYVVTRTEPTDEEINDYYEQHKDEFTSQQVVKARHLFSKSKEKIDEYKQRIDAGEKMTTLIHKFSEDDMTRGDGGDLGYFNPGGYIRFVGFSKTFSDAVFALEPHVVSDPIKWEKGWSIVYVVEKEPEKLKPLDEARDDIIRILRNKNADAAKAEVFAELKDRYQPQNFLQEELALETRSAEELWNLAQTATDPRKRLIAYEEIVEKHSDSEYTPQALFMVGFVFAEELKDPVGADRAFNKVLKLYPGTDVAKSAEWMLKNLNKPLPDFEDLDDLHKKILEEESKKSE
jgi:EpsD family peptidyl-prolyl cis-trans isomerase